MGIKQTHPHADRSQDHPADISALRQEVATLRREVTRLRTLRREVTRLRTPRQPRAGRARLGAAASLALLVALVPLSVLAVTPFADLTGGGHDANIDAIYQAGITTGCDPTHYCPTANVTREEMASFLARLGGLGANKPVANAARLSVSPAGVGSATYAANDLVRATRQNLEPDVAAITDTTEQNYGAPLSITAPAGGFVLVTASVEFTYESGTCPCNAAAFLRHVENTTTSTALAVTINSSTTYRGFVPLTWVFPVTPGVHTFQVVVRKSNNGANTGTLSTVAGTATALYVPFGGAGAGSLGVDDTPAGPGE